MPPAPYEARGYWDRRLASNWSLQGVGLRGSSVAYNTWLYRVRNRMFHRVVDDLDLDPTRTRVLEVGPGVGFYSRRWLELGARVTGVDIADTAVARLGTQFPTATFRQLDITDPDPELARDHDVAWAFDVLFHIVDDDSYRRAIENVSVSLIDGGWFVLTESCAKTRTQPMRHYVRRSYAETASALSDAGFEIVSRRPAFVLMQTPFDGPGWQRRLWKLYHRWSRGEVSGAVLGAVLFAPELLLTRLLEGRAGPTTEVLVCRKTRQPTADRRIRAEPG